MKTLRCLLGFATILLANELCAAEYATFNSFYSSGGIGLWGWIGIGVGTLAAAAIAFFTFGAGSAAVPAWMAAVAGWIGSAAGYSGVAAVNFGLALLGGGSVAAGGLGMAGGAAVLVAASTFCADVVVNYGVDVALETWQSSKFVSANKNMMTLPVPRNKKGGKAYKAVVEYLDDNINHEVFLLEEENQIVLRKAKEMLACMMEAEKDADYQTKDRTLMALLCLQLCDYAGAEAWGRSAVEKAFSSGNKPTLPQFILAMAQLSLPQGENCDTLISLALTPAYKNEPKNKLMPIMTACCADRLWYKYHFGKINTNSLRNFWNVVTDEVLNDDGAAQSLNIIITRGLVELKRDQQDILCVCNDMTGIRYEEKVMCELKRRLSLMRELIPAMKDDLIPKLRKLEDDMPDDADMTGDKLAQLLNEYDNGMSVLEYRITYGP